MPSASLNPATSSPQSWSRRALIAAGDIKLAHSVFAMPFAMIGAVAARNPDTDWTVFAGQFVLVVLCMVAARTWAMLVNRLVDHRYDAANPRTAARAIPTGRISTHDTLTLTIASAGAFVLLTSCFGLFFGNWWPLGLSVLVLLWIAFYSITKRFTWLCHIFLGTALAVSPLAAAVAIRPEAIAELPMLWFLSLMVMLWVAGFDVIYALQDLRFDRDAGLFSLPSRLGVERALWVSRAMHSLSLLSLLLAWRTDPRLGSIAATGVVLVAMLLLLEHRLVASRGERGLHSAFFTINGVVSCILGLSWITDLILTKPSTML